MIIELSMFLRRPMKELPVKNLTNHLFLIMLSLGFTISALASNNVDKAGLSKLEQQNQELLSMKAAGECTQVCNTNNYYPYDQVCKTSCPDSSGSTSYRDSNCGGSSFVVGCLTGGVIGSLGTPIGTTMAIGCVALGAIYAIKDPPCN